MEKTLMILVIVALAGCNVPQQAEETVVIEPNLPSDQLLPANAAWLARYDDCFETQLAFNVRVLREVVGQQAKQIAALQPVVESNKPVEVYPNEVE